MRKLLVIIFVGLFSGFANGQGSLVANVDRNGSNVVPNTAGLNGFEMDVSAFFDIDLYSSFKLVMTLPENITWNQTYSLGENENTIAIGQITVSNNTSPVSTTYTIDMTSNQKSSVSFNLLGLLNFSEASCTENLAYNIDFELLDGSTSNVIDDYTSILLTQIKPEPSPNLTLYAYDGQEQTLQNGTGDNHFPYYVDVYLYKTGAGNFSELPDLELEYPDSKLSLINAVQYRHAGVGSTGIYPFHADELDANDYSDDTQGKVTIYTSDLNNNSVPNSRTFSNSQFYFMRFYFNVNQAGINAGEVKVTQSNAKYNDCEGLEVTYPTTSVDLGAFSTINTGTLLSSFENRNNSLSFCSQHCDFSIGAFEATFQFESNVTYTDYTGVVPTIKIECPDGAVMVNRIYSVDNESSVSVDYTVAGNLTPIQATLQGSGNSIYFDFGNDIPEFIYVSNYEPNGSGNFNSDFYIQYSLLSASQVYTANDIFTLSYESYANTVSYNSSQISKFESCNSKLRLEDRYENNEKSAFVSDVDYDPGTVHTVRLKVFPHEPEFFNEYDIIQFKYRLNDNLEFDPNNLGIYYKEGNATPPFQKLPSNGSTVNGLYYRDIKVERDPADERAVLISAHLDNTTDCNITDKSLYFFFEVLVENNASRAQVDYVSTTFDADDIFVDYPTNTFPYRLDRATWNVTKSENDRVTSEVIVVCSGDNQAYSEFEEGSLVKVRYVIENENQNPVKGFEISIPTLVNAEPITSSLENTIVVRSVKEGPKNYFDVFNSSSQISGSNILLNTNTSYLLPGRDKLYIEIDYRLQTPLTIGTIESNITFQIPKFFSLEGFQRAQVIPLSVGEFQIVESSACIPEPPCLSCVTSFAPIPGKEYLLGAWVKEEYNITSSEDPFPANYTNSGIQISFNDGDLGNLILFRPAGPIVDGWQRIESSFIVPDGAYNINIEMVNNGANNAYFDDIRIHPFRSNMKTYVYDPSTQRLTAELDENNYSTFYEYDDEGNLIRVKKETERGVMTIQETRINQSKVNPSANE